MLSEYQKFKAEKDPFWSDIPHEKSKMVERKKKRKYKMMHLKKSSPLCSLEDKHSPAPKRKKRKFMEKPLTLSDDLQDLHFVSSSQAGTSGVEKTAFHLYVKSRRTYKIEIGSELRLNKLHEAIEMKEKIPVELQMLTHNGKLIRSSNLKNLERGDTIHVIIRGKGGVKGKGKSQNKKDSTNGGLSNVATEEDVRNWLKEVVKVPDHIYQVSDLSLLDVDTLQSYTDAKDLKEELKLPIGLSRKLLFFKDNLDKLVSGFKTESLECISSETIASFAFECLKTQKNIDKIVSKIKEEYIDGLVVMLYEDHANLADDLDISKALGRKLLIYATKKIKETLNDKIKQEINSGNSDMPMASGSQEESTRTPGDDDFVSRTLGIRIVDTIPDEQSPECELFAIHSSWENSNELSQMFLFWVICRKDDFASKDDRQKLWKSIVRNIPVWLDTLPNELRTDFTPGKSALRFQYKGRKSVSICKTGEKLRSYSDINLQVRENYKNHILILHENVSNLAPPYRLLHQDKYVSVELAKIPRWVYGSEGLKTILPSDGADRFDYPKKDSEASEITPDGPETYDLSYYGDMIKRYGEKDAQTSLSGQTEGKTPNNLETVSFVRPRQFNQDGLSAVYFKDWVIDRPECGSRMMTPSLEFKFFRSSLNTGNEMSPIKKFLTETLRFACGCLNRRRNGTIYFGIADDKPVDGQRYRHGQVIGFPIMEVDNVSKNRYTDELDGAKCKYFDSPEAKEAARECIKAPVFVKVSPSSPELPLYVLEVDIEPSSHFCKGIKFKLDLSKLHEKKQKSSLYVRDCAETKIIDTEAGELQFVGTLNDYDTQRNLEEKSHVKSCDPVGTDHKYMADKLIRKLCKGTTRFDPTLWPILVSSKPADDMKMNIYPSLSFISNIPWSAVFEFDNDSSLNGLCKHFFSSGQITHTDGDIFRDVENNNDLRHRLRLPENCVFIFCNGRSEQRKPHLLKHSWKKEYSPSVKGAINFFQQRSVVPIGRAVIMFLLFSSDFEGFLDVFGEITTFFGNEQVVLICADRYVYDTFRQSALLQQILPEEDLESNCVVGMPWQQSNECINRLLGVENPTVTSIPSSSGATVVMDRQFEESLDSLEILSCTQCEDKKFETTTAKKQFSSEKELKFYQGNRVEWWNFFFEGHVMERHCFRSLKSKVLDALNGRTYQTRVVPIFLIHEPGAGGSTLARHVLWEFRKDFRCAIITKLKEKTAMDILSFWRYKENDLNYARPVLLLIDSVPEQRIDPDELPQLITKQKQDFPTAKQMCVLLICMRDETLNTTLRRPQMTVAASEVLPQKIDDDEIEWLKEKIENLETTSKDLGLTKFKGEYFITFMILHSNFNKVYLRETVTNILKGISFEDKSFKLLVYVALLIAYVRPSKCGGAIAIPIECCSELMGINSRIKTQEHKTNLWENELDGRLKILLVTEPKENGSGKQIRMAHRNLAETVIECTKNRFGETERSGKSRVPLAEIAIEFLESDILKTWSYAKAFVIRLSVEMLIRRKKEEYDDDETTNFSPLIESILQESKSFEPAAKVLMKGFDEMEDCFIAHQLARLYLDQRVYKKAKKWAKKAVRISPKRSSFIHTLGYVCKLTFLGLNIWDSKEKKKPDNPQVLEALEIALEAFEVFAEASTCDKSDINLVACYDVVSTANCIAKFVYEYVDIGNRGMIHRYFTDDEFLPESVQVWDKYHRKLKSLSSTAWAEIEVLDEHIYYSRRSYASKFSHEIEEHRHSRTIKRKLPDTVLDFSGFFGEDTDKNEPPAYVKSDLMRDAWHRRSIVTLGGKRLVDVFKIIQNAFSRGMVEKQKVTPEEAASRLQKIHKHLNGILDKSSDDYLNIISVNLALAQLKAPKQIAMKDLYEHCLEIVRIQRRRNILNMAYLYITMFLWPRKKKQEVQYNHAFMLKSIRHLFEVFMTTKQKKPKLENDIFKRENNVFHSVVLFYAAKGKGLSTFCHHTQLPMKQRNQQEPKEQFWQSPNVQGKLRLINGHTRLRPNSNSVSVIVDLNEFGIDEELEIRNLRCRRVDMTEIPVSFFLGFSLSGPVVCYIRPRESVSLSSLTVDYIDYDELSERELRSIKRRISELKTQKDLSDREKKLVLDEQLIDDAILQYTSEERLLD